MSGIANIPVPRNEPVNSYAPGTPARAELKAALTAQGSERVDIPVVVGGEELRSGNVQKVVAPHRHSHVLAETHQADKQAIAGAITAAVEAQKDWAAWRFEDRAAAGKQVERGKVLEYPNRIVGAQHRHRAGEPDAPGEGCRRREHDGRRRRQVIRPMVFADAEDIQADLIREHDFLD